MEDYKEYLDKQVNDITYNKIIEATLEELRRVGIKEADYLTDVTTIREFMRKAVCECIDIHRSDEIIKNTEESTVYEIDEEDTNLLLGAIEEETGIPVSQVYIHEIDKSELMKMLSKQRLMHTEPEASHKGYANDDICLEIQMEANNKQALHIYCTSIRLQYLRLNTDDVKISLLTKFTPILKTKDKDFSQYYIMERGNLNMFRDAQRNVNEAVSEILDKYEITSNEEAIDIINNVKTALRTGNKQWLMLD